MTANAFRPLPESVPADPADPAGPPRPQLLRGAAAHWPAVRTWTFPRLAALDPDLQVELVVGNRESGSTRCETSTFGEFLDSLGRPAVEPRYLKEFDLLTRFPQLRTQLRQHELLPSGRRTWSSAWIGPAGASTGLHHDLMDNVAVQVIGRKRFLLCAPGTLTGADAASPKYDRWARLAPVGAADLAVRRAPPGRAEPPDGFFVVDLEPGDVLHVPAGWWHEVVNLTAGLLLSGFHGPRVRVAGLWARTGTVHLAHRLGLVGRRGCTCHPQLGA